ncbi:glycosyltransferase family 4 protein [Desulfobacula sp.]|uniref:glycosyltransferase family 4 protein n=1 Tax=Desulfobacula sp. TaxID=2593537 RepID=UPI002603EF65|nr:glycosyltransferase family 4 protein [Desulfobacula sp.]
MLNIFVISKRQYTNRDLIDDRFGRVRNIPYELAKRNNKVYGLCLSYQKKAELTIHDGSVEWESMNIGTLKIPGLLRFYRKADVYARKSDIILAFSDSIYGIIGYLLAKKYDIPLVFDLYDNFEYFKIGRLPVVKQIYRRVVRKCDGVTCVSSPLAKLVKSYGREKAMAVIENAAQDNLFKPLDKKYCRQSLNLPVNAILVGTAGALCSNRGISSLFKAFDLLKDKYPELHLVVAGPRDIDIPVGKKIHDLGVIPHETVPLLFNAMDVAVVCNKNNKFGQYCFPQKAREIMACGVPIIAADIGGACDLLMDNPEWLFKPDNVEDLTKVLENRLNYQTTNYKNIKSWSDISMQLEKLLNNVSNK